MLDSQQPKIDISQLPANAIDLCGRLVALSQDYANRCLIILDPFLSTINNHIIDYFDKLGRIQQIPIMHAAILAAKRPLLLELNLAIQYEIDVFKAAIEEKTGINISELSKQSLEKIQVEHESILLHVQNQATQWLEN